MKKQFEAAFLLAGTAIGSGMLSLPIVLAKFGILNTCIIMLLFAILTYATAIIRSDININLRPDATLKDAGNAFECQWIGNLGDFLLKLLHFSLMAAYLSGFSSVINSIFGNAFTNHATILLSAVAVAIGFLFASKLIIKANKILFITMFFVFMILVLKLFLGARINFVPDQSANILLSEWTTLVPVVFTSFGFQGAIHSMTKFCDNDRRLIKNACFWGSLIPAIVYITWTTITLLVVSNTDTHFFQMMLEGASIDIGELVTVLSKADSLQSVQIFVKIVSALAILTSVFGVGLSLMDMLKQFSKWKSISVVIFVPVIVSVFVPNAFIKILNVSGMILAFMATIAPVCISLKMQKKKKCRLFVRNKFVFFGMLVSGVMIIALGILDFWICR